MRNDIYIILYFRILVKRFQKKNATQKDEATKWLRLFVCKYEGDEIYPLMDLYPLYYIFAAKSSTKLKDGTKNSVFHKQKRFPRCFRVVRTVSNTTIATLFVRFGFKVGFNSRGCFHVSILSYLSELVKRLTEKNKNTTVAPVVFMRKECVLYAL